MPSTPSPLLRLELQATGENLQIWGEKLNGLFRQVEQAIASSLTLSIVGNRTLTADNYAENEYRRATHILTFGIGLAAPFTITVPPLAYVYRIDNRTAFAATLKTASGVGAVVRPGMISVVFCDGTDCKVADPTLDQVKTAAANVDFGGYAQKRVAAGTEDTDGVNRGQVVGLVQPFATSAGSSATSAANSASAAAASATTASNAATSATGSASSASTSATNAANSATAAQQAINGTKVSPSDTTPGTLSQKLRRSDGTTYPVTNAGGSELLSIGVLGDFQEFLTSGTWTKPVGATWVWAEGVGAGGGGYSTTDASPASGGGGGAFNSRLFRASEVPASVSVVIPSSGLGGANGTSAPGASGGSATFGSLLAAPGGVADTNSVLGGRGGGGELGGATGRTASGGFSSGGGDSSQVTAGGGRSIKGGAGGGAANGGTGSAGGISIDGGNGGAGNGTANQKGGNGSVPGGGGGASTNNGGGGDGGAGRIRVWAW